MPEQGQAKLVCIGPTGVGYFCEVESLPRADEGVVAAQSGAMLVCDAPIVASRLAQRHDVTLVTNSIGGAAGDSGLARRVLSPAHIAEPDGEQRESAPFDILIVERSSSTRTFVSTNYYPRAAHITEQLQQVARTRSQPLFVYVDAYLDTESGENALGGLAAARPKDWDAVLYNVGDVRACAELLDWLPSAELDQRSIVQVALKEVEAEHSPAIIHRQLEQLLRSSGCQVVVTLGGRGAVFADARGAVLCRSTAVPSAFTVGAGAIFSSEIINAWLDRGQVTIGMTAQQVQRAVDVATSCIAGGITSPGPNCLLLR